jgi:holo-[acyl-carrier protein] synthase
VIRGIGVDIVRNARFESWLADRRRMERFFSTDEIDWCLGRGEGAAASLAARFAAREAFAKALGTGFRDFALREVCVVRDDAGKPSLQLSGKALERFRELGAQRTQLSLSHERDYAVAFVVIE